MSATCRSKDEGRLTLYIYYICYLCAGAISYKHNGIAIISNSFIPLHPN